MAKELKMLQRELKMIALAMTLNCVRNTVIEKYHCAGKISDAEMKALNKEVVNRIFTFLDTWLNRTEQERSLFLGEMVAGADPFVRTWDEPELDKNLWAGAKTMEEREKQIREFKPKI